MEKTEFFIFLVKDEKSEKACQIRKSLFCFCRMMLSFSCLQEKLIEEVTCIIGKDNEK